MIKISALTVASQKKLAKARDIDDLKLMAAMAGDVRKGSCTVDLYRSVEKQMCEKYGFVVR